MGKKGDGMNHEERILEAALKVVKDHTISGTRMHLIAEEAGMLKSNIHYYYKTKDDLMYALQTKVLDKCLELREELNKTAADTLESKLDVFIEQKRKFIMEHDEYDFAEMDFWQQGRIREDMRIGFANSFARWRADIRSLLETFVPDMPEEMKTYLPAHTVSFLEGATIQYLIDRDSFPLDEYLAFGKKVILELAAPYR